MKKLGLILSLMLVLSACQNLKDFDVTKAKDDDALLLIDMDVTFDGDPQEKCFLYIDHERSTKRTEYKIHMNTNQKLVSIPGGGIAYFAGIQCAENNILYAKVRRKVIEPPLAVKGESGMVTYPGTLVVDWESEGVGLADLLLSGAGGIFEDEGSIHMKRTDRTPQVKAIMNEQNPAILQRFDMVTTRYEKNKSLIQ